jgi:arylsulfatase A-like enzyme
MKSKKFKKTLIWALPIGIVLAAASIVFIQNRRAEQNPNVVLVLIDTLRADHTGIHGYSRDTTPNLDRIAKKGLKLENFYVNSPWTKPSVASIISGLYPTCHGSRVGQFEDIETFVVGTAKIEVLNSKILTMAEIFKARGFETHAYITNYHLTPRFGYHQGYDFYNFNPQGAGKDVVNRTDRDAILNVVKILKEQQNKKKPAFIYCHLMSVHGYRCPLDFEKFKVDRSTPLTPIPVNAYQKEAVEDFNSIEEAVCSYDNSIYYTDSLVGELFDFISAKSPDTMLVVLSDHGEEFYEHGGFEHCRTLYNEILKVPCVFYGPGVPQGVFTGLADSIDILPTLMQNLDIKISKDFKGQVLFQRGRVCKQSGKEVFAEQHHRELYKRFALIRDSQKMILNQHKLRDEIIIEFYRNGLTVEKENCISSADRDMVSFFERRIKFHKVANETYFKKKVGRPTYKDLNPEDIEHLRSLGYIK